MALQVVYKYKQQTPDAAQRRDEGTRTLKKYPSKVPVCLGKASKSDLPELQNHKLLLSASSTVRDLCLYINDKLKRPSHAPLFIYLDQEIVAANDSELASLFQEYRENDYFLYLTYYEEMIYSTSNQATSGATSAASSTTTDRDL